MLSLRSKHTNVLFVRTLMSTTNCSLNAVSLGCSNRNHIDVIGLVTVLFVYLFVYLVV